MKPTSKIKSKKADLPLDKMTGKEQDYVGAILEEMRSDFRAFGEALSFTNSNVAKLTTDVAKLGESFEYMRIVQGEMQNQMGTMQNQMGTMQYKLDITYEEVGKINERLTDRDEKDKEKSSNTEIRFARIEKHLNLKVSMA